jgi:PadR family transcriptional regulator PadR
MIELIGTNAGLVWNALNEGGKMSVKAVKKATKIKAEKDMYGYEMIDTLRKKSCNVFELKAGTLYPLLHGLEGKGLLKVYEQEYVGKTRKYYSITKEGRALLETKKAEWNEYQSAVANVLAMGV